jgi:hypothetical protein
METGKIRLSLTWLMWFTLLTAVSKAVIQLPKAVTKVVALLEAVPASSCLGGTAGNDLARLVEPVAAVPTAVVELPQAVWAGTDLAGLAVVVAAVSTAVVELPYAVWAGTIL